MLSVHIHFSLPYLLPLLTFMLSETAIQSHSDYWGQMFWRWGHMQFTGRLINITYACTQILATYFTHKYTVQKRYGSYLGLNRIDFLCSGIYLCKVFFISFHTISTTVMFHCPFSMCNLLHK